MAAGLPRFIVIKQYNFDVYVRYRDEVDASDHGYPVLGGDSVFSTLVKIEVEPSKTNTKFVHLRFCHSNKYFQRDDYLIFAKSNQPEEDTSKPSCTLFEPTILNDNGLMYLNHVSSGGRVEVKGIYLNVYQDSDNNPDYYDNEAFYYMDWDALVKLPASVAFKGDNGSYLKAYWFHDLPYLRFSSSDPNDEAALYQVQLMGDGHVRIKSLHFDKLLRNGNSWIWADAADDSGSNDVNTLFWPVVVKAETNTIGLRSAANNQFCKRLTADNKDDCLNASASTLVNEAQFQVQELVLDRKIYNVDYRMEDARIFDEKPFLAGTTTAKNETDIDGPTVAVQLGYEDSRSYSFSRSLSITAGVSCTIEADVLSIVKGEIEFSFEVTGAFEWANVTTTTTSVMATGTVPVPAKSRAIVNYVGTVGTCNVPFSYIQQDKSSTDGKIVETKQIDGIYTGVNCYNFSFEVLEYQPL